MSTDGPPRRELRIDDLSVLAEALRAPQQPLGICRVLERVSGEIIGHRLFTVMRFDAAQAEVQRIHSSLPDAYPVGGRKKKNETAWADQVLHRMTVFRGANAADIRTAFDDQEKILHLGLGSVLNIPVVFEGHCLGTMNLLHQAGWYRAQDEGTGLLLAAFLIPALFNG